MGLEVLRSLSYSWVRTACVRTRNHLNSNPYREIRPGSAARPLGERLTVVVQASLPACRTLDERVTIELRASSLRWSWFLPRTASWAAKDGCTTMVTRSLWPVRWAAGTQPALWCRHPCLHVARWMSA